MTNNRSWKNIRILLPYGLICVFRPKLLLRVRMEGRSLIVHSSMSSVAPSGTWSRKRRRKDKQHHPKEEREKAPLPKDRGEKAPHPTRREQFGTTTLFLGSGAFFQTKLSQKYNEIFLKKNGGSLPLIYVVVPFASPCASAFLPSTSGWRCLSLSWCVPCQNCEVTVCLPVFHPDSSDAACQ